MAHLAKYKEELTVIDRPDNSLDLISTENCWSHMKLKPKKDQTITFLPKTHPGHQYDVGKAHTQVTYLRKLARPMPRRIKLVLQNKGKMTKYWY
jgi:hypothetical protein